MTTARNILKSFFLKRKKPTEGQFAALIDSFVHLTEDNFVTEENLLPPLIKSKGDILIDENGGRYIELTNISSDLIPILVLVNDINIPLQYNRTTVPHRVYGFNGQSSQFIVIVLLKMNIPVYIPPINNGFPYTFPFNLS